MDLNYSAPSVEDTANYLIVTDELKQAFWREKGEERALFSSTSVDFFNHFPLIIMEILPNNGNSFFRNAKKTNR